MLHRADKRVHKTAALDQWNDRHAQDPEPMVGLEDWSLVKAEDKMDAAKMRRERLLALRSALTKAKTVKGKGNDTDPGATAVAPDTDSRNREQDGSMTNNAIEKWERNHAITKEEPVDLSHWDLSKIGRAKKDIWGGAGSREAFMRRNLGIPKGSKPITHRGKVIGHVQSTRVGNQHYHNVLDTNGHMRGQFTGNVRQAITYAKNNWAKWDAEHGRK